MNTRFTIRLSDDEINFIKNKYGLSNLNNFGIKNILLNGKDDNILNKVNNFISSLDNGKSFMVNELPMNLNKAEATQVGLYLNKRNDLYIEKKNGHNIYTKNQ